MSPASRARPEAGEFLPYYATYIALVPDGDIVEALRSTGEKVRVALAAIPEEKGGYAYADGKWTIRTLIGHVIDAERIFTYRALRLARADATPLPGFEENDFAKTAGSDSRTVADLAAEMTALRDCTVRLFASLPEDAWTRTGTVNNGHISVRAIAYITAGHAEHHLRVLREKYSV